MGSQTKRIQKICLAVGFSCVAVAAQVGSAPQSKTSSVTGTVTNSVTGEPVAHAHITLRTPTSIKVFGATTLVDGRFSISEIPPERYTAYVERYGYSPLEENGTTVDFKASKQINDLALHLVPDAVISGRVLDANGVPVEKTNVAAVSIRDLHYAATDDRGEFRIGGLRRGQYLVRALSFQADFPPEIRTDGTVETNYAVTYYPGVTDAGSATAVLVRPGQETSGIEIKLVRYPILHISGTVLNVPERLRSNVRIQLNGGLVGHRARIEPDMRFTIWRVQPGHYQLLAECEDTNGTKMRSAPIEITVTNTSIEGLNLPLSPPYELTGQVDMPGGEQLSERKNRASVILRPLGALEDTLPDGDLAADGSFKLKAIFPGSYYVSVKGLPSKVYVKSARVGTAESVNSILDLRGLSEKDELLVQLGTNGAEVSGIVRNTTGPVAGVPVVMFFDNAFITDEFGTVYTGTDGGYSFEGVPPGKYKLLAWPDRWSSSSDNTWLPDVLAISASVTEEIDVIEGDKISQDLKLLGLP